VSTWTVLRITVLEAEIAAQEQRMRAGLDAARARFKHAGIKGSVVEETLRSFLREYLPRRLEIGHGEIVDTFGNRSRQTDVVITTEDHPYTFKTDSPGLFFIEGVAAAAEVKAVLTSANLADAVNNARTFKRLEPKVPKGANVLYTISHSGEDPFVTHPWFLFAFESELTLERARESILDFQATEQLEDDKLPDAVFALDRGCIINFRPESKLGYGETGQPPLEGLRVVESSTVLYLMLGWLTSVTPRTLLLGTPFIFQYLFPPEMKPPAS
jgi:hypothetical protein